MIDPAPIETGALTDPKAFHEEHAPKYSVDWADPDLDKIIRLRLLSDPGLPSWDVSYCYGVMKNGDSVRVRLPFGQLPKGRVSETIVNHAKRDGVFAKGLGIFDCISTLC